MKKRVMTVTIIGMLFCMLSGCGRMEETYAQTEEELPQVVIGIDTYPPFSYTDENGEPTGIDVELATEALGRMGYRAVFQKIKWEDKNELLESGQIDCIWSCYSMDGREDLYRWAGPYMVSRQVVAVNEESDIYSLSDLEGKIIAIQATTKPEKIFLEHEGKIPEVKQVYSLENRELIYAALGKGYVDAIAAHETAVEQYMKDYEMSYRILDEDILTTGIGAAFSLQDDRMIAEKLSETMDEMRKDGSLEEILSKYVTNPGKYLEVQILEKE